MLRFPIIKNKQFIYASNFLAAEGAGTSRLANFRNEVKLTPYGLPGSTGRMPRSMI